MAEKDTQQAAIVPSVNSSEHVVAPDVAVSFLKSTMPFRELDDDALRDLAQHCKIDFYPKGTRLLTFNESEITHLYLIQRGGVRAFITDDDGDIDLNDTVGGSGMANLINISRIRAVKVWLVVRSQDPVRRSTGGATMAVGGRQYTPNDDFAHTLFTTTIRCRNKA